MAVIGTDGAPAKRDTSRLRVGSMENTGQPKIHACGLFNDVGSLALVTLD
jgi:hypothetical protein